MSDASQFVDDVRVAIAAAALKARDGLTLREFGEIAYDVMRVAVEGLESVDAAGPQKKQWALDAVAALFDTLADKMIPTYAYPIWLLVRPSARSLLLHFSDGAIESVLRLVREEV
jgi:hypothetical protein